MTRSVQPFRPNVETTPYKHTFLHVPCKPPVESRNALLYIYVPTRSVRSPRIPPAESRKRSHAPIQSVRTLYQKNEKPAATQSHIWFRGWTLITITFIMDILIC